MKMFARVRVSGPLVPYAAGFAATLQSQGYRDASLREHLRLVAHLSRWLAERAIETAQITATVVDQFIADRRRTHTARPRLSPRGLDPLLRYLQAADVLTGPAPEELPDSDALRAYARYLLEERVVKPARRRHYLQVACEFLADRQVADLVAADVVSDVRAHVGQAALPGRLTALRSVLGFLFLTGRAPLNLVHAVPSASRRRLVSLPKGLDTAEMSSVLATCDRRTTKGRRDYAALVIMVRLGLRAGEVAALTLDDVDWEAGEVVVHGKGGSTGRLPLPADVGEAIVAYLRRRPPRVETRSLFLRSRAPQRGGTAGMFVGMTGLALRAAGISYGGSHRLRHTTATQMLRAGASLTEIAQVLRHRHVDTTAIYAKVDRDGLRTLAQAWPNVHTRFHDHLRQMAQPWPGGAA